MINSPLEAFFQWVELTPNNLYLRQFWDRSTIDFSYNEANEEARKLAAGFKELGLDPGSHIAIFSKNCAHWVLADLAIMMAGCVSIPVYPTLDAESVKQILSHSDSRAIIIGKLDDYESQKDGIEKEIKKIGIGLFGIKEEYSWEEITQQQAPLNKVHKQQPNELITIMYTSGTTGNPKGVMHTVNSFHNIVVTMQEKISLPPHPRYFSYLPLTHVAERIGIESSCTYTGGSLHFPESLDTFAEDLEEVQPQVFLGVPRIWQKFKEKILEQLPQQKLDLMLKIPIVSTLLKKKIKKRLGLSEAITFAGAAPMAIDLLQWFAKLGITIHQVYALTEDCLHNHFNLPSLNRFGTCGKPLPGVEVQFSSEGEIQIKSKCLTRGYYKEKEKTAAIFTEDGFLKTGDIGRYDEEGFLLVTGRIKDQFKTDKGKYINPAPIELELLKNPYIDQVCIVGTGLVQPIALSIPSEGFKQKRKDEIRESLKETLREVNKSLQNYEKIKKIVVMKEEWTSDNGFLTPTLKIKRNKIENAHKQNYYHWFSQPDEIIFI